MDRAVRLEAVARAAYAAFFARPSHFLSGPAHMNPRTRFKTSSGRRQWLGAAMTLVAAAELGRVGVTVNAIAPVARTRMTEGAFDTSAMAVPEDNSPIVAWLASEEAGHVTGRVFEIDGSRLTLEDAWRHGATRDAGRRWEATELGAVVDELIAEGTTPEPVYGT